MKLILNFLELEWLFSASSSFGERERDPKTGAPLPLSDNWADRAQHEADVLQVWKRVKGFSRKKPMLENGSQPWQIGPENPADREAYRTKEFGTSEEERDGLYHLCYEALDPRSSRKLHVAATEQVVWPILEKIRRVGAMKKKLESIAPVKRERLEEDAAKDEDAEKPDIEPTVAAS